LILPTFTRHSGGEIHKVDVLHLMKISMRVPDFSRMECG
jgi:hypothetical protein